MDLSDYFQNIWIILTMLMVLMFVAGVAQHCGHSTLLKPIIGTVFVLSVGGTFLFPYGFWFFFVCLAVALFGYLAGRGYAALRFP